MGLDVNVHVITKDFEIVKKSLFDFLPYDFRFTFYFTSIESIYKNSCGDFCDSVYSALDSLDLIGVGWTSLVKVLGLI